MLKNLFSSLVGYKTALLSVLLAVALAGAGVQTLRLAYRGVELQAAVIDGKGLRALLDVQNIGIKALEARGQQLDAAAGRAEVAVNKLTATADARAKAWREAPTPTTCPEAMGYLRRRAAGGQP